VPPAVGPRRVSAAGVDGPHPIAPGGRHAPHDKSCRMAHTGMIIQTFMRPSRRSPPPAAA